MKKSRILKIFISSATAVCIVILQAVFAFAFINVRYAENNTDFAIKSADVINSYGTSRNQLDSAGEMLRIIGRTSAKNYRFTGFGASAAVIGADGRFLLQFSNENAFDKCLEHLNSDPEIIYAEKDRLVYTCASEEGETADLSWGVEALGVGEYAEKVEYSPDTSVTVAIVDSGIEPVDFVKDKLVEGYDFVENEKGGATDKSVDSHGTFLASIVADCVKDAAVSIMPVRVLKSKTGSVSTVINGIYYAVDNGADVVNLSLGGVLNNCKSLDDAVAYADSKNASVVVCAGNSKQDIYNYCPAHNESAITVTAIDPNFEFVADFKPWGSEYGSNYGDAVDVCAPGKAIIGYNSKGEKTDLSGTSMSAAFISACAALVMLEYPEATAGEVQQAIKDSCTDLGDEGFDVYYGYGLPDMSKVVIEIPVTMTSVAIKTLPEKVNYTYKVDSDIDLDGLTLEVSYSDGSTAVVSDTSMMKASGYSAATAGNQTVTVEYEGFTVQYGVKVEYAWWQWIIRILLLGFIWY